MLKVQTENMVNRQVKLIVLVEDERFQTELRAAASRISRMINIPGFRKGKAPYPIVARYVGEEAVYDEALEPLGQSVYKEALTETGLDPYALGTLDDVSRNPLTMTFTVPLKPEVDLGDYRTLRVPFENTQVTKGDIEHQIEHLLDEQAVLEPVEKPVEWNNVALLDIKGVLVKAKADEKAKAVEDKEPSTNDFIDRSGVRVLIAKKANYPVPGFPDHIVGMIAGENRAFDVKLSSKSEDIDENLRGRTVHFDVTCSEVLKRDLPELDDEFARSVGDYEDLTDLRAKLRIRLERDLEYANRNSYVSRIFKELLSREGVTVSYPPVVVEQQVDDMIDDFKRQLGQQGLNLDDYLNLNNLTLEDVRADFQTSAEEQIKRGLIVGKVCEVEQITVDDSEMEDEIQTQLLSFGTQGSLARQLFSSPEVRRSMVSRRLTDKGLERLTQIARGEAPPLEPASMQDDESTASAEKNPKASKSKSRKVKTSE